MDGPDTDARHITVLRRQLTSARDLLIGYMVALRDARNGDFDDELSEWRGPLN